VGYIDIAGVVAIMGAGAVVQGSAGFGSALVAAPLLVLIDPRLVPGPILLAALVLDFLVLKRDRASLDIGGVKWIVLGMAPGSLLGAWVVARLNKEALEVAVGLAVYLAVGLSLLGLRVRASQPNLTGAGFLSGLLGTATSLAGPPLALVYQHATGSRLRATLAGVFIAGAILSLVSLALVGRLGRGELGLGLVMVPGVLVGFAVSSRVAPRLDRGFTRPAVLIISAIAASILLLKHLL